MTTTCQDQTLANGSNPKPGIDQIKAAVERTREDLAETVDALSAKLDVKRVRSSASPTSSNGPGAISMPPGSPRTS